MKDNIKYSDKIWSTAGTHEIICDSINEDNSDVNSEGLTVGFTEGVTLVRFYIIMLGISGFSKAVEEIVFTLIEV